MAVRRYVATFKGSVLLRAVFLGREPTVNDDQTRARGRGLHATLVLNTTLYSRDCSGWKSDLENETLWDFQKLIVAVPRSE
jgi:hypothetical protein